MGEMKVGMFCVLAVTVSPKDFEEIRQGALEALAAGPIDGYPVQDVRVVVYDFKADLVGTADKSVL